MDDNQESRMSKLKRSLYSRNVDSIRKTKKGILHEISEPDVPTSWEPSMPQEKKQQKKKRKSVFRGFFVLSALFLLFAIVFAAMNFLGGANTISTKNVDIEILGNSFTPGGEPLELQIEITNRNATALEFADLLIEYPRGASGDVRGEFVRERRELDVIPAGKRFREKLETVLFGEQGSEKIVHVTLEYRVAGSNAIFVKEAMFPVTISTAPLSISIAAPDTIVANQEITFSIETTFNTSTVSAEPVRLILDYPPGFEFKSAIPEPSSSDRVWELFDKEGDRTRKIEVTGTIYGQNTEEKTMHVFAGTADPSDPIDLTTIFNSLSHTFLIERPFLETKIFVNGSDKDEPSARTKNTVEVEIAWTNNLLVSIENVEINVLLSGGLFDESTVKSNQGFFDSATDTIRWTQSGVPALQSVGPGETGRFSFEFNPKPLFQSGSGIVTDPTVSMNLDISGIETASGNLGRTVSSASSKTIKFTTDLNLTTQTFHASGPFVNTGFIPPRAETPTTYTLTWTITNTSNRVTQAEAKTTLPTTHVKYAGVFSPSSENLTYNPITSELLWKIGDIMPGTGFGNDERSVSFQITLTPSGSQVNTEPNLTSNITFSGRDAYTGAILSGTLQSMNTRIFNDPAYTSGAGTVLP